MIKKYENFITDLFKKKSTKVPLPSVEHENDCKYCKYKEGDIVKFNNNIGIIKSRGYDYRDGCFYEIIFNNENSMIILGTSLSKPTIEEIEQYKFDSQTKKYNL